MYTHFPGSIAGMSEPHISAAPWGIEIEHDGSKSPDYFAVESIILDESGVHLAVADGTSVEYAPGSVKKILVLRSKEITES